MASNNPKVGTGRQLTLDVLEPLGGQKESNKSLLRTEILQEHNRSQFALNVNQADPVNCISSWMCGVSTSPATTVDPNVDHEEPEVEEASAHIGTIPHVSTDLTSVSGAHLVDNREAEKVHKVVERVQSLLRTDDDGKQVTPVKPSAQGRYRPRSKNDKAFKPIEFSQMLHVAEADSVGTSRTSLVSSHLSPRNVPSMMRRVGSIARELQERRLSAELDRARRFSADTEATTADSEAESTAKTKICLATQSAAAKVVPPKIGIGTGVKLHSWKKRAENAKIQEKRKFALDEQHLNFLKQTNEKIAVEIPLPIKIAMFEELFPVICQTVKMYEKELGKRHQLTRDAIDKLNTMQRWGSVLMDL